MRLPPLARGWFLPAALALLAAACTDDTPAPLSTEPDADAQLRATGVPAWLQEVDLGPAIAAQERHTPALRRLDGVVGTGVGVDEDGKPTVRVYTMTPGVRGIPARLDDVPVRPVVTGMFVAGATTDRARPALNGYSVGHPDITAGTLGAVVRDGSSCHVLSNNHVLANSNGASIGDNTLQPGPYDGGTDPADAIAALYDFEPLRFDGSDNTIDAAISQIFDPVAANVTGTTPPPDHAETPAYGAPGTSLLSNPLAVGQTVQKFGRTTAHTHGQVTEVNVAVDVCYKPRGPFFCARDGIAHFVDQIGISPGSFSDGGDSGSLIVTDDSNKNPVGLLFAGSGTRTLANPIEAVLNRFAVAIETDPANNCGDGGGTVDDPPSVGITDPADGSTVSGTVSITADATDDGTVDQVEFLVDDASVGTDTDGSDGWSASWDTNTATDGSHTLTAVATDDGGQTGQDEISVTVDNSTAPASGMHVGDLDATSINNGRTWDAVVAVSVHDSEHGAVSGASVLGTWSGLGGGSAGSSTCTTGAAGSCTVDATGMRKNNGTVSFSVTDVTHASLAYSDADNHDPDGDSDGTTVIVGKP